MIDVNVFMTVFAIIMFLVLIFASVPVIEEIYDNYNGILAGIAVLIFALGVAFFLAMMAHYGS